MHFVCGLAGLGDVDIIALRALPLEASSRCAAVYPGYHVFPGFSMQYFISNRAEGLPLCISQRRLRQARFCLSKERTCV